MGSWDLLTSDAQAVHACALDPELPVAFELAQRKLLRIGPTLAAHGARALLLGGHLLLEALLVDLNPTLLGKFPGQLNREAVRVMKLECVLAGDARWTVGDEPFEQLHA